MSCVYSKKRLILVVVVLMLLTQALIIVLRRRELDVPRDIVSSKYVYWWDSSQNKAIDGRISSFVEHVIPVKDERIVLKTPDVSRDKQNLDYSSTDNNRVQVKIKSYKDIEKSSSNIFYIESRCGTRKSSQTSGINSAFNLNPRQCCSVESAATMNPTRNVYILHTCPLGTDFDLHLPKYARNVLGLRNVFLVPLTTAEALEDTPVTDLYRSGKLETSNYPVEHASDILRLAVLWRFGGTYCDLDIVFIRSLQELHSNFCALESPKAITNAILNFEPTGYGHELLAKMLKQVNTNFNGQEWAVNGPDLITDTMLQECNATIETVWECTVFTVYNQSVLCPLPWRNHADLFEASVGPDVVKTIKDTGFTVHFWNKFTSKFSVKVGSSQAYGLLADEFCPAVYRNCGDTF